MAESSIKRIGRYEVQEELGRGGYGRVYRAYDPTVGRLVAIKILTAEGKDILTRFRNEAASAGNLNHRNIVTIYDFGDFDGVPYIAMEFLAGDDLSQLIGNRTPLTLLQKVSIMLQVADGLDCAHRNGIVHRDVKPANIRLLPDGTVKIMDFGIARVTRDTATPRLTLQGDLLGTLLYMSPEQVMGGEVDSLTDIFAYGVTYYELLTGQHPFHAADPGAVLYKITSQDPEPVRNLAPDCPELLEQVIRRALHRERELRYPSLRELQIDTEPILIELRQERARQLLEQARDSFAAGDLEAARAQAMEALDLDPSNRETRELRAAIQQKVQRRLLQPRIDELVSKGQQALEQRRISEALESFEAAVRLDSTNQQLKGQAQQVRTLLERSRSALRRLAEARREFTRRDYAAALRSATEALEIDPDNADAARFLDQIRAEAERQARFEQALEQAKTSLEHNRFDEAGALLESLDTRQRDSSAAKELLEGIAIKRDEFERRERLRAEIAAAEEDLRVEAFSLAVERLRALGREFPKEARVSELLRQAETELEARRRADAVANVDREARALVDVGQFKQARALIERNLRTYPRESRLEEIARDVASAEAAWSRQRGIEQAAEQANALRARQSYQDALKAIDAAVRKYGDDPALSELKKAVEAELAGQRKTEAVRAQIAKADALRKDGRLDEAVRTLETAERQYPGDAALLHALEGAREALARRNAIAEAAADARTLSAAEQFDRALEVIRSAQRDHGDDPALREAAAIVERDREARRVVKAIEAAVAEARALLEAGEPEEAIARLESLAAKHGLAAEIERALGPAREALAQKRKNEAIAGAESEVRALLEQQAFERAREIVASRLREYPGETRLAGLEREIQSAEAARRRREGIEEARKRAEGLRARSRFDEALKLIDSTRRSYGDDEALVALAETIGAEREAARRADAVRRAVSEAGALLKGTEFGRARRVIDAGLRVYPGEARLEEARKQIDLEESAWLRRQAIDEAAGRAADLESRGDFDRALAVIEEARRQHGVDAALTSAAERIAARREAKRADEAAWETVREAEALLGSGRPEEAVKRLEAALSRYPGRSEVAEALDRARTEWKRKQRDEAIQQVERNALDLVKRKEFGQARQAVHSSLRSYPGESRLVELEVEIDKAEGAWQRQRAVEGAVERAEALQRQGKLDKALELIGAAQRRHGDDPALASLAAAIGNEREALRRKAAAAEQARREQAQREQAERERAAREQAQREQAERERAAREKAQREQAERTAREKAQREQAERERAAREKVVPQVPFPAAEPPPPAEAPVRPSPLITPKRAAAAAAIAAGIIAAALLLPRGSERTVGDAIPFEIRTVPSGATVTYEGGSCVTPDCRIELAPGDHAFEARLPGHRSTTATVAVARDSGPRQLDLKLEPLLALVQLTTNFAGGNVLLDGRPAGSLRDGQFALDAIEPGRRRLELKSSDGGATLEFETGPGGAPTLAAPPQTQGADAIVVTSFGGEVIVNCADCSGEALIDGVSKGRFADGRLSLKGIADGSHELEIKDGSASRKLVFEIGNAPRLSANLTSKQDKGILVVETGLDDAVIFVNGRRWPRPTARGGQLTITLESAEYTIRAEKPGFQANPAEIRAAVRKGEQVRAPFRLEPLQARLTLAGQSPGATVAIDGKHAGAVNADGAFTATVPPGDRRIELSKEGFQPVAISRSFGPGEGVRLGAGDLQLQPVPKPPEPKPVKATPQQIPQQTPPPAPPPPDPVQVEAQDWERVRESGNPSALADFLTRHPGGRFARQAEARIEELEWNATDRNNRAALDAFLRKHPRGQFADPAAKAIAGLEEAERRRAEVAAVLDTIQRYQEAYKREDADAVRALYVNMPSQQFDEIRNSFRVFRVLNLQLTPDAPQISGDKAVVRCARTLVVKDNRGAELPVSDVAVFTLVKQGNQWRIGSLASQKR
ncbi:MAG: protein kinase [Bryobacteraceae bacterium]|nr:protein kinase [Bryobacteraceae bacterium]